MLAVMLRDPARGLASLPHQGVVRPVMMSGWLHRLAVVVLGPLARRRAIVEIIAHAIAREDLRRHQPRANVAGLVTQHKAVKAGLLRRPILARRDENRPARSSGRSAK